MKVLQEVLLFKMGMKKLAIYYYLIFMPTLKEKMVQEVQKILQRK